LAFAGEALMPASYLIAFSVAAILGRHCREAAGEDFTDRLWASLIIASVLSAGIGMAQWLKVQPLDTFTPPADVDGRAIANVGQANHLATLICWGLIGLWRARLRGQIGAATLGFAAAYLLFGLALTQSRTPWAAAGLVALIAVAGRSALGGRRMGWALLAVLLAYVAGWIVMVNASDALQLTPPRDTADQTSGGARPLIWAIGLEAIAERPWLGWGWNQFWVAWSSLAPGRLTVPGPNGYAHNLVLDLLIWNGVVIGGLVVAFLVAWLCRTVRAARSSEQWLLLAGVVVFGVHSVLELPHAYLLLLLPVAAMMGALSATTSAATRLRIGRAWLFVAALGLAALLAAIVHDYRAIEARHQSQRVREAGIWAPRPHPPLELWLLRWMAEAYSILEPRSPQAMSAADAARLRTTVARYSSPGGLLRYSQAAALHGDTTGAAWGLRTLCGLHRRPICEAALGEWREFANKYPSAAAVPLPPIPQK
jgi:hypothetical protein